MNITIPHLFTPRPYQIPLLEALDSGKVKRACVAWHRRCGKDKTLWNFTVKKAVERPGMYFYFLPTNVQGRKVIWDGMDSTGLKFLDHIPEQLVVGKNGTDMKVELINGSIIQIVGTDKYDSVRGTNPIGVVFSEYAFQDPRVWDVIRPILDENGGWAVFNSTPNGENHFYEMHLKTIDDEQWFSEVLTIDDTKAISQHAVTQARHEGVDEDTINREYYCSFSASVYGAYYGPQMKLMKESGRILPLPVQTSSQVYTAWDLGRDDATSIWFFQVIGKEFHFIHYFEGQNEGMEYYVRYLLDKSTEWGTRYAKHLLPHDGMTKTMATNMSAYDVMTKMGIYAGDISIVPRIDKVLNGINKVRSTLSQCYFDPKECDKGLAALRSYTKKYDENKKVFLKEPKHDWASHAADALRTFATGWSDDKVVGRKKKARQKQERYNPLTGETI